MAFRIVPIGISRQTSALSPLPESSNWKLAVEFGTYQAAEKDISDICWIDSFFKTL